MMQPGNENDRSRLRLESGYRALVGAIAALVMATGALVLVGWVFGIETLVRLGPDYNPMRFNAALCLAASGGGVGLIATGDLKRRGGLARWLGVLVFTTALLTLAEHLFGWDFHIDQLLWHDSFSPSQPGRMVPLTAIFLVWTGIFLLLSASRRTAPIWTGQIAAIFANLTAQGAVLDLIFRSNKEEGAAAHTAAAMFALSVGMLLLPNRKGVLAPLTSSSAGGRMIRSLVPIATLVPLVAGWVYLEVTRAGLLTWGSGIAIVVLLNSASLLLVTIWTANSIDSVDLRLSAIVDSSDDAIFSKTIDGIIVSWNPGAERLFGYAASEVVGRSMLIFVPPERHRELEDTLRRVSQGESVKQLETVRVRNDGARIDVSVTLSPLRNARGEVTAVSAVAQDITARKQAEKASRSASRYARSLIEASLDPLVTISREGKITDVNEATEKVVGISREGLIGTDFSDYFTEPEKARQGYQQAFAESTVHDYPLAIRSRSGVVTEVLYNASVFRNEAGEVEGVFAAARDVTERNRIETARIQAAEALHELNLELESRVEARTQELAASMKELESFAYSVSHDLRAPLRHMDGFLTLLSTRAYSTLDESSKHYIDRTLEGSRRMGKLIDDLLQFSRIGRTEIHKTPLDLNLVIQEVLKELEPEISKRNVHWRLAQLPRVDADRAMLLQVAENLVANALKFTRGRETAEIEIGVKAGSNREIVFFVRDNGAGFDMRYYNKLFQVFQRLHAEHEFEGTGIGLAIARTVVERHGGRIWAEGSLGEGATFYFSLPADCNEGGLNELTEAHLAG